MKILKHITILVKTLFGFNKLTPKAKVRIVYCSMCDWNGTVAESLNGNRENDRCPVCGESRMAYEI